MGNLNRLVCITLLMGSMACKQETPKSKSIDLADLDTTVSPAADFDSYANGGWKKRFPIPDEKSRFGSFDLLADSGELQVQTLITEIASQKQDPGTIGQKIADFYNTGMDTAKIESDGLAPLQPLFDQIAAIQTKEEVMKVVADLHVQGIYPMFSFFADADQKNSERVVAYLYQGGLGMPDRDYYMKEDDRSKEIQAAYQAFLQKMFVLTGADETTAQAHATIVYDLEKRMAAASMTLLEQRDPHQVYHKMDLAGIQKISPEINWMVHFAAIGLQNPGEFIVGQPAFIAELGKMLNAVSVDNWKIYLKWQVLESTASYLSKPFVDQNFEFYGKTLTG